MGEQSGLPTVAEVAHYLQTYAPDAQRELRADAALSDLLAPGQPGGGVSPTRGELERRARVVRGALDKALADIPTLRTRIMRRIGLARGIKVTVAIIASLCSAGTVMATLVGQDAVARVSAGLAFVASVGTIIGDNLVLGRFRSVEALLAVAETLSKSQRALQLVLGLLGDDGLASLGDAALSTTVAEANAAFGELTGVMAQIESI